ncbi:hypothetical protein EV580_1338 [Mycobacterium sp. BK086]|uniref:hypothetical protein n=1 Tax=Mycobacterium sp. BK086 TaxID=2512165 RepID=UPI0010600853|nr:hypothetical protein [Mycobacterium sp. BK086]TDO18155.1 hypothetical protein EV580_1338 [Mycobacterium sp. BK086]
MPELQGHTIEVNAEGLRWIAAERARQIVTGYTPDHDAEHGPDELIRAAFAYAAQAQDRIAEAAGEDLGDREGPDAWWPWDASTFSPSDDAVESLAKAGALIAAALDVELARRGPQ